MQRPRTVIVLAAALMLAACDPGVHLAYDHDFDRAIDPKCVDRGIRSVVSDVSTSRFISDGKGHDGFPAGTSVTNFYYGDPTFRGGYSVRLATLPSGKTRLYHEWFKIGTDITTEERSDVVPYLRKVAHAINVTCQLSLPTVALRQGAG